jgi:hypothetical protein
MTKSGPAGHGFLNRDKKVVPCLKANAERRPEHGLIKSAFDEVFKDSSWNGAAALSSFIERNQVDE